MRREFARREVEPSWIASCAEGISDVKIVPMAGLVHGAFAPASSKTIEFAASVSRKGDVGSG